MSFYRQRRTTQPDDQHTSSSKPQSRMAQQQNASAGHSRGSASTSVLSSSANRMVSKLKGSKTGERAGQEGEAAAKARPGSLVTQLWEALDNLAIVWNPGECEDWPDQNVSETEYLNDGVEKFAQGAHNIFRFRYVLAGNPTTGRLMLIILAPACWSSSSLLQRSWSRCSLCPWP